MGETEKDALLAYCCCALANMPLSKHHTKLLAPYRYSGLLIGSEKEGTLYPANVPVLLEKYVQQIPRVDGDFLVSAFLRCLKPFLGEDGPEVWEAQVHGIIAARVLCRQQYSEPPLWKEVFSVLEPFEGCQLSKH